MPVSPANNFQNSDCSEIFDDDVLDGVKKAVNIVNVKSINASINTSTVLLDSSKTKPKED